MLGLVVKDTRKNEKLHKEKLLFPFIILFEVHYFNFPSERREGAISFSLFTANFFRNTFSNKTSDFNFKMM